MTKALVSKPYNFFSLHVIKRSSHSRNQTQAKKLIMLLRHTKKKNKENSSLNLAWYTTLIRKNGETKVTNKTLTLPKQALPSSVIASALYNALTSSSSIVLTPGLLDVKAFKRNSHHKIMCKVTVIFSNNLRRLSKNTPSAKDCCPSCHQTATE